LVEKGRKIVSHNFVVFLSPISQLETNNCLFGISIPKNLVKKAVNRNYCKRQIRNMLILYLKEHQNNCALGKKKTHYKMIIIIRQNYLKNDFTDNQSSLYRLLFYIYQKLDIGGQQEKKIFSSKKYSNRS
jgi:ribonuclease P protein component